MEFELSGVEYRAAKIDAMKQFHIVRKLAPLMAEFAPKAGATDSKGPAIEGLANALAKMSDADSESLVHALLGSIKRKEKQGLGFSNITNGESLMFQDIDLKTMMQLAWQALQFNFKDFFSALTSTLDGANQTASEKLAG